MIDDYHHAALVVAVPNPRHKPQSNPIDPAFAKHLLTEAVRLATPPITPERETGVRTGELVESVRPDAFETAAGTIEVSATSETSGEWWSTFGDDPRQNAVLAARHWRTVLPDSFRFFHDTIRDRSLISPVTVTSNGHVAQALLYYIYESSDEAKASNWAGAALGFSPATMNVATSSRIYNALPEDFQSFYTRIHSGFTYEDDRQGRVPALDRSETWSDSSGYESPDEIADILEFNDYIPDPNKLAILWDAASSAVLLDVDRPDRYFEYMGGVLNQVPSVSSRGFRNSVSSVVESNILGVLGYRHHGTF